MGVREAEARPLVSVIVPVRDKPAELRALLERLEAQTVPRDDFEIVIGDDGSRGSALSDLGHSNGRVRVVSGPPRTSYAARNRAVSAARGAVLAFCDSDCLPEPTWLAEGLDALERADVVAGEVTFVAPERTSLWSLLTIDMFLDQEQNVRLGRGVTANLFVRRESFELVGGYDETLPSGGDYDFVRRLVEHDARLAYAPAAVVRHPTIDAGRTFLRKVWHTNRWAAVRRARAGGRPDLKALLTFVPFVGVTLARRHALRSPLRLCEPRLAASGVDPSRVERFVALSALYFVVAYVAVLGRMSGWIAWRQQTRRKAVVAGQTVPEANDPAESIHA